ncbi:MAG: tRNA (N(6)-L-threonylcarbamoyladenosine(37)-C(2))-methylthiotransferase MtaB [Alphaproteobacteria bacterium]|nr:tRNA (N(6)-L-threonylcarbamoyladenosine(37)-C(2))-methylthiotransferase MtaB [Alphaproteobacteria bacterium]
MAETEIITFGCRLNAYESEVMRANARAAGLEGAVIVNTCAVTAEAERQARQAIRRARRRHPEARIIVTGCAVQVAPSAWAAMPEVDQVIGNLEKLHPDSLAADAERIQVRDIMTVRETAGHLIEGFAGRARAFLEVQQGCDHRCTFCIIPFGRGNSRSVPLGIVVEQARRLVANGYEELVLTGVDLTSYGADLPGRPTLGQLVRRLLALVPELRRLRLSSLDPVEIDDELFRQIVEEPRLMPHLHLSVQSGDDMVLKRMKRRHLRADVIGLCRRIRAARPEVAFGADMIAGFPTEDPPMHENSVRLVEECDLAWLHVFPYSPRPGTPAARMPQVPRAVAKERAERLRGRGEAQARRWMESRIGSLAEVLIEEPGFGHAEDFAPVTIPDATEAGRIVRVHIDRIEDGKLLGRAAA